MASASSSRPCVVCQRGLSGSVRRTKMMRMPITGPMKNPMRQPQSTGKSAVFSKNMLATAPSAAPPQ